jgi:hypothetical protein
MKLSKLPMCLERGVSCKRQLWPGSEGYNTSNLLIWNDNLRLEFIECHIESK